ncbi:MAG: type II CRISPR RNA-guided endonuclease Cas9 [Sphingobium sp.]
MKKQIRWRFGGDLGTNSLGWAAVELDDRGLPISILSAGSRIFSDGRDPKSGASLAVDRRDARAMRRRRDRFQQRQRALMKYLVADGLFPADPAQRKALAALDPYELRARALDEALPLPHLGRALFHLNQRRGFKSNRKTDRADDAENGKIAIGVERLVAIMREAEAHTYGEWLHLRRKAATDPNAIPSVRARMRPESGDGATGGGYDFYPSRALLEDEFREIWEAQAPHHPDALTDEVHARLFEIIFHQRPLKPPQIGKCMLVDGEDRLPKAHPLFQRRRLLEEINALMIVRPGEKAQRLTHEERNTLLLTRQLATGLITFDNMRKALKLDEEARFNKESENRKGILGDEVTAIMGAKTRFGTRWAHLPVEEQWDILQRIIAVQSDQDYADLLDWLGDSYELDAEHSRAIANARLPQGYGRVGQTATTRLIEALRDGVTPEGRTEKAAPIEPGRVIVYSEAVVHADLGHHSDLRTGEIFEDEKGVPHLPYYGVALERHIMPGTGNSSDPEEMRIGRLTNPTVHIGLNQLRRIMNRLIRAYGPPAEIAIELARELKLNDEDKKRLKRENAENQREAERRGRLLDENGIPNTGANRARLRLWEELNGDNVLGRACIYSGEMIGISKLFSDAVEIDHILPFSATLDDSNANKIVCIREANRVKRKRSPYEARLDFQARFGAIGDWEEIASRAAHLPRNKRWRFEPDAADKFRDESGFLARHLVDTQYLGRLAREYLACLYPEKGEDSGHIWVSPGRLTEMVRRKLGLNDLLPDHNFGGGADQPKNRLDHRHHAIDAVVVAIVDRALLQKIARISGTEGIEGREKIEIPAPWEGFREDLRKAVNAITVSHRPDHGTAVKTGLAKGMDQTAGRLHNDTAYGLTGETDAKGNSIVVRRVPLSGIKKLADLDRVRDATLKAALYRHLEGLEGKAFEQALAAFPKREWHPYPNIRRVRMVEPLTVIPIRDREGRTYKGYKGDSNYRYDVWELPDGKWVSEVVSMFEAHQPGWTSAVRANHPTARKMLSLHQDDLVAIEREGEERTLMRIVKFGQSGQITLAAHRESGDLKRRDAASNDNDPFKYFAPTCGGLKKVKARQVRVDELGRVLDPGFPPRTARRKTRKKA